MEDIETKKAFKESDLKIGSKYSTTGGMEQRMMTYGGKINEQYVFMYESEDLIISLSHGEPRFSKDEEVILDACASLGIYEYGSKEYNDRKKIIEGGNLK